MIEFLKALFEDGQPKTFEQLQEAVQSQGKDKLNIVNLADGAYVSKSKYQDDIGAKERAISELQNTLKTRSKDLDDLKNQLTNAATDTQKLTELQNQFTALQGKYDTDTKAMSEKLKKQSYEFAVRDYAAGKKFTSNAAKRDFINSMIAKNLQLDNGKIIGADDFTKTYTAENSDAFAAEQPANPAPQIAAATGNSTPKPESNKPVFGFNFRGVRPHEK